MHKPSKYIFLLSLFLTLSHVTTHAACTPAGTAGDDTIVCTGTINSFQYFYGGSDTVTLNHVSDVTYYNAYWLDEALGGNPVTDGDDTFIAHDSRFSWVLGFGGDDRFEIYNSIFQNIYGDTNPGHGVSQRGNDTLYIENSYSNGWILGGNDNDKITLKDSNVSFVAAGYSDIYGDTDYTPFDGNDTIILDHVNFTAVNYYYTTRPGAVDGGKGDDTITFIHGGEAFNVTGGHGNDVITVGDAVHFNACTFTNDIGNTVSCGIYGDEPYASESNTTAIPLRHGNDVIDLLDADLSGIMIHGGDGSDKVSIDTPVIITDTTIDGGDDRSMANGFTDQLLFDQWSGEINGSSLLNWEQIILDNSSVITFLDMNLSTGYEYGIDPKTQLPYGLILQNYATLKQTHDFTIEGNLHNSAIIDMQDTDTPGTTLNVANNYTSDGGELYMDVTLNDASVNIADKLHVMGNTEGMTTLHLKNIDGLGGQTPTADNTGILLIEVLGTSNGTFVLNKAYEVGAFKYTLNKGSNGNWYLRSEEKIPSLTFMKDVNLSTISSPASLGYTFTVTNTGNVSLTGVIVSDTLPDGTHASPTLVSGDSNSDAVLDVGETWIYHLDYRVTQSEIDRGDTLINRATVTTDQAAQSEDNASTSIIQLPAISLLKEVNASTVSSPTSLKYTFTVENRGNMALSHVILNDPFGAAVLLSGDTDADGALDMDESWIYTLDYTVTQARIDTGTDIVNTASVTCDQGVSANGSAVRKIAWITAQTTADTLLVTTYSPYKGDVSVNDKRGSCKPSEARWELVTPALHGDVTLEVNGSYNYIPDSDYHGNDQFEYRITFPQPCPSSNVSTVSVKVACATTQASDCGAAWSGMSIFIALFGQGLLGLYVLARKKKCKSL
ncbi:pertactin-like passenger domain-containing protein [Sulfurovum sp.]|uniref:DUF7507 domain-containing protein n=1 Tax=Sulfurovum sp. TaxID=1969726 RepID=UPI0025F13B8A|nr:pertactin-like passenger domain-containing protein [Sulfurovum sp.]